MRVRRWVAAVCLAAVCAAPIAAQADEAELRRRMQELEEQQKRMAEEMQNLRRELDKATAEEVKQAEEAKEEEAPKVQEIERRQGILTEEVRRLREALVLPEDKELKSYYGLGPAASKVYSLNQGLSLGGYGEYNFSLVTADKNGAKNQFDYLRFVLYVGYKFNDWIVFNSETEFEHGLTDPTVSSGEGEVRVEFATLDFLLHPMANVRTGLMLVPVGFINELHEPPFYLGNVRPPVETQIIPTTWSANGVGLFGELLPGLEYRTYGLTSFNAKGFTNVNLRGARQSGNRELANDWSWVLRLDYAPIQEGEFGFSGYLGDQGQSQLYGNEVDGFEKPGVFQQIWEIHAQYNAHGVWFRWLGTHVHTDDAAILSQDEFIQEKTGGEPIADSMWGTYVELAYDVMPWMLADTNQYLAPWFRYSWLDTQNGVPAGFVPDLRQRRDFYEFGLQYKPIPQVVLKLDYHIQDRAEGTLPDELRVGGGFIF